jgi:hypothetical protein
MAQKKKVATKNKTKEKEVSPQETDAETSEDSMELDGPKAKKGVDLESALEPAVIIDEKSDEDVPVVTDDDESSTDELSLDDEELNPFGDKWEQ